MGLIKAWAGAVWLFCQLLGSLFLIPDYLVQPSTWYVISGWYSWEACPPLSRNRGVDKVRGRRDMGGGTRRRGKWGNSRRIVKLTNWLIKTISQTSVWISALVWLICPFQAYLLSSFSQGPGESCYFWSIFVRLLYLYVVTRTLML